MKELLRPLTVNITRWYGPGLYVRNLTCIWIRSVEEICNKFREKKLTLVSFIVKLFDYLENICWIFNPMAWLRDSRFIDRYNSSPRLTMCILKKFRNLSLSGNRVSSKSTLSCCDSIYIDAPVTRNLVSVVNLRSRNWFDISQACEYAISLFSNMYALISISPLI